ncbi:MAG: YmdB family metallophosphoesterase, partial [Clostridiales bacterium]|nr:YmdB family metallophosphoesterase [Clostridiales bacterium]
MNILMIGDIVGREGRDALTFWLPTYKKTYMIDLCIANAENSAGGKGITDNIVRELQDAGVDVIT